MNLFNKKKEKAITPSGQHEPGEVDPDRFFREIDIEFLVHELKDPIAVIETGIRTLLERREKYGGLTSKQEKTLRRTLRNSKKARDMLKNLLEIGRSQSGCFAACRFNPAKAVLQTLFDALETNSWKIFEACYSYDLEAERLQYLSECGITMNVDPESGDAEMFHDEVKFCQVVGNLIKNALHHREKNLEIRLVQHGSSYAVEVADDGPGIDAAHHEMIFQRYTRLDECTIQPRNGHGLGLAGARILARRMGGDIVVSSRKRKGTTFRLTLPLTMET